MSSETVLLNKRIATYLINAIDKDRLHHAVLFHGPQGTGKDEMAIELARALNCTGSKLFESCRCGNCRKINRGAFSDVKILEADGQFIRVEAVRRVVKELSFPPFEGKKKVYVVKNAETMNPEAANTMLKSLEEPPPHVQFILVSAFPHRLLPTIRSRCQQVAFPALTSSMILEMLEGTGTEEDRQLRNMLSGGSIRRARDMDLKEYRKKRQMALNLMDLFSEDGLSAELLRAPDTWLDVKEDLEEVLKIFFLLLRDLLVMASTGRSDQVVNNDLRSDLERMAEQLTRQRILQAMEITHGFLKDLRYNVNRKLAFDAFLVSMDET